ncbi:hypothetical protein [Streptomyces sp. MS2.AVA.5]|uniref:Uncharacterized protein n=1 Tax=Streptomyces achmelvichensis TaxID=3134111 RepID=A0ACC6PKY9_9ACTN
MLARDAVELGVEDLAEPVKVSVWEPAAAIGLRLDGQYRNGRAYERRDVAGDRIAFRVGFLTSATYKPGVNYRETWVWGDPRAMALRPLGDSPLESQPRPGDAVRLRRPLRSTAGYGEEVVESYRPDLPPQPVQVRVGGEWHRGNAYHRYRHADGRLSVRVIVRFDEHGWTMAYVRRYWWDPAAITEDLGNGRATPT